MALNKGFSFVLAAFQDDESVSRGKIRPRDSGASLRARRSSLETIGDRSLDESRSIVSRVVVTANLYFGFILGDYKHARPPFRRTRARARATAPDSEYIRGISGTCATYGIYARRPFACQI